MGWRSPPRRRQQHAQYAERLRQLGPAPSKRALPAARTITGERCHEPRMKSEVD
jgi:hypothetical protein